MNELRRIGEILQETAEQVRNTMGKSSSMLRELQEWDRQRRDRAQAGLERERNAYWIRKNAEHVRRQERSVARQPVPNRADMRANQSGGMIWSQRHRPARPSETIARAERERQALLELAERSRREVVERGARLARAEQ